MFGLGFVEILILVLIAFLVFGPKQFPSVARNFVKLLNELRMAFTEVKTEFYNTQNEAQKHIHQLKDYVERDILSLKDSLKEEVSLPNKDSNKKSPSNNLPAKNFSENVNQNLKKTKKKQEKK